MTFHRERHRAKWLGTFALICIALLGCTTPDSGKSDAQIRDFVAHFVRTVNEADAGGFVACFTEDATAFFPSSANAVRRTGRSEIRAAVAPTFAQGRPANVVTPRDLVVSVDRHWAYVTFDGGSGSMHARRTLVLQRQNGAWLIAHLHASNVSEAGR
jgi:uncharacterized protein (TIGR02246 family)